MFGHELSANIEGDHFDLAVGGPIKVELEAEFVHIGCVRMRLKTWHKLVTAVDALLGSNHHSE
jgi:hypothetical protein